MKIKNSIIVTGGAGFVGSNLLDLLLKKTKFNFSPKFGFLDIFGHFGNCKNARTEISRRMHRLMLRDLSYDTHLGPKTKTENWPIFQTL